MYGAQRQNHGRELGLIKNPLKNLNIWSALVAASPYQEMTYMKNVKQILVVAAAMANVGTRAPMALTIASPTRASTVAVNKKKQNFPIDGCRPTSLLRKSASDFGAAAVNLTSTQLYHKLLQTTRGKVACC